MIGFALQRAFARRLPGTGPFAAAVREGAARLAGSDPAAALAPVRYRLRRDGLRDGILAEAFACYGAAAGALPGDEALAAARWMAAGGIAELAAAPERRGALALAAFARALQGDSVHLLAASEPAARALAEAMSAPLARVGMRVGLVARGAGAAARREAYAASVVCGAHREIGHDYLRDVSSAADTRERLRSRLERASAREAAALQGEGPDCVLTDDADVVLLDDALAPLMLAAEADQSGERLVYEQALELARALDPQADFVIEDGAVRLSEAASQRVESLVASLGGLWAARRRREELLGAALHALHGLEAGVDYRVEGGAVVFPPAAGGTEAQPEEAELRRLVEVKEGCRLAPRRTVVARLSLPRWLARYRTLAGACADAEGIEAELWSLYGAKTARSRERLAPLAMSRRVFADANGRRAALLAAVRAALEAGRPVLVAMRSPAEAERLQGELRRAQTLAAVVVLPAFDAEALSRASPGAALLVGELPDSERQVARVWRASAARSCELFMSLEDEAVAGRLAGPLAAAARLAAGEGGEVRGELARRVAAAAQRAAGRACRAARAETRAREQALDDLLAFSGQRE